MRVELRLANPGGRIPSGMLGEVRLSLPRAQTAVIVPISAVIRGAKGDQVVTVAADSTLLWRPVQTGRNLGPEIEILGGLAVGDEVVSSPNALLQPGARVVVKRDEVKKG
jgi:multidrug efflux pump subunit AcrA (membrane-fusion protein)